MAGQSHKIAVKIYSVGQKSSLLHDQVTECEFDEGGSVSEFLRSIRSGGKSLYDEIVQEDGTFGHGYAVALNGELVRCEELDSKEITSEGSNIVVLHLLQIPAGG